MFKSDKQIFIDRIVGLLDHYCPTMFPEIKYWVACQFALESNFGTSEKAVKTHNLCGMKIPSSRASLNYAISGTFSKFYSDVDCVIDYVYLLCYNKFNHLDLSDLDLFRLKLKNCKYCPDSDYIDKINKIFNQLIS